MDKSRTPQGLALPLEALPVVSSEGFDFGWCVVDAGKRVLGYCLTEAQAKQLVAPFARSESGDSLSLQSVAEKCAEICLTTVGQAVNRGFAGPQEVAKYLAGHVYAYARSLEGRPQSTGGPTHYYCMDCDEYVRTKCKIEGCPIPIRG